MLATVQQVGNAGTDKPGSPELANVSIRLVPVVTGVTLPRKKHTREVTRVLTLKPRSASSFQRQACLRTASDLVSGHSSARAGILALCQVQVLTISVFTHGSG